MEPAVSALARIWVLAQRRIASAIAIERRAKREPGTVPLVVLDQAQELREVGHDQIKHVVNFLPYYSANDTEMGEL